MKFQIMDEFGTVLCGSNKMSEATEMAESISSDTKAQTYIFNGNEHGIAMPFGKAA